MKMNKMMIPLMFGFLFSLTAVSFGQEQGDPLKEAKELFNPANFKQAKEKYIELAAREEYKNNIEVHKNLAILYFDDRDYDKALTEFNKVIEIDSNQFRTYFFLGLTYEALSMATDTRSEKIELRKAALSAWQEFSKRSTTHKYVNDERMKDMESKDRNTVERHIRFLQGHLK